MTASCQRGQADLDAGMKNFASCAQLSERPAVIDLTRIESRYPRTRSAALARFLRGYLYFSVSKLSSGYRSLRRPGNCSTTAACDYALFYRAESEAANDAKSEARRDYGTVHAKYPDSLKAREAKLRDAEMAARSAIRRNAIKELARMV